MTRQEEVAAGLQTLTEIFRKSDLNIRETKRPWKDREATYLVFGKNDKNTDIALSDDFLSDLPNTREHKAAAEAYARSVVGRTGCGSPEEYYCRSGTPIRLEITWPIRSDVTTDMRFVSWLIIRVTNMLNEATAPCSIKMAAMEFPPTPAFERVEQIVNLVRDAIDGASIVFYARGAQPQGYQVVEYQGTAHRIQASEQEIQRFLIGKAYYLGFRAAHSPHPIWVPDPWDASYLGTTARALSQAAHVAQARKLITLDNTSQYASPSDKLLSDGPSELQEGPRQPQKLSLSTIPHKEEFNSYVADHLGRGTELALLIIDLDHFKNVNDTQGHQAGDACLERVIETMGIAIGGKGTMYRWGRGDEFAVCLPHFSAEEAAATAERIRRSIENSGAGGSIKVTASIGVCSTDQVSTNSVDEFAKAADDAMYASKKSGKNRITVAYKSGHKTIPQRRAH